MKRTVLVVFISVLAFVGLPANAYAMHISEGILPLGWATLWFIVAAPFIAAGLIKLGREDSTSKKPLIGLIAAAVFVISCMPIPVPTAGTCSHPAGTGMAAILIGPLYSILAAAVSLVLQALFLAHGGLSTWGANVCSMGVAGSIAGWLTYAGMRRFGAPVVVAAFFAGLFADWATYMATSGILAAALTAPGGFGSMFWTIAAAFVPTQLPLGILEGVMTAGAVRFLYSRRPELIGEILGSDDAGLRAGEAGS